MANIQPNGSFESVTPALTDVGGNGRGGRITDFSSVVPYEGNWMMYVHQVFGLTGGPFIGNFELPAIPVEDGKVYQVRFRVQDRWASSGFGLDLRVYLDSGDGNHTLVKEIPSRDSDELDWIQHRFRFTADGTSASLRFTIKPYSGPPAIISDRYFIDTVEVEDIMAVKLAERAVDAVKTVLEDNLETELDAIKTERGDNVDLPVPSAAHYYLFPKQSIIGGECHIEIFEDEFAFDYPYSDADAGRATFEIPLTIRLTHYNRENHSPATMATISRRYAVGLFSVINKNPTLEDADASIQIARVERVTPIWIPEGEESDKIIKSQITVPVMLRCEEVHT